MYDGALRASLTVLLTRSPSPPRASTDNLLWPKTLLEDGTAHKYKTLIIGTGSHLWKAHAYTSSVDGCTTQGGLADAFRPISSLGYDLPDWHLKTSCDVFPYRYPIMVQNIARFLGNLRVGARYFDGHVIVVTSPPNDPGCATVSSPGEEPATTGEESDSTKVGYYSKQVQHAEAIWWSAFQKWAPRLKLSVLNITHISRTRADARTPGDCGGYCYPGLPHVWSEMLLRLLEQQHMKY